MRWRWWWCDGGNHRPGDYYGGNDDSGQHDGENDRVLVIGRDCTLMVGMMVRWW